jgi:hypothetical protein
MKIEYLAVLIILFTSCNYSNKSTSLDSSKLDTIIVRHTECTDCLDVFVVEGKITIADSVKSVFPFPLKDLLIKGKNSSLKDIFEDNGDSKFLLIGYFYAIGNKLGYGKAPEFYVVKHEKL